MAVLAYITDLFFQAKVGQTAKAAGIDLKIVTSLYHFLPRLEENPEIVLIDLNANGINPRSLIVQIKENHPDIPVIAYAAHVEKGLLEQARQAGADQVLSRAKLTKDLAQILKVEGSSR